ncbi:MAG: threonine/serine exporter family protein [Clostridiales bacterium]|uniref:threonine/serine exporter family protein n=1 Tax=Clostridium sp. N3C TaxID=1776758 RepID=UPI00092E1E65|nr:threonine/serine exporter family protein [Clostridium sp. N3C]NLZ47548.1 threonine/serine exporter family protein [Clostridiales bacterium]SCN21557.1 Inner membrane protein YjjP [Clostridium sp. N3C]
MNNKDINAVVHIAVEAGRIILENGGETYRVEDTINRICTAFGVRRAESFVTPTGIMMSVTTIDGNTISMVKRIQVRTVNLEKICKVNELSRNISKYVDSIEEINKILEEIDYTPRYSNKKTIFYSALAAGFFTLIMGGSFQDFFMALITGFFIKSASIYLKNLQISEFFINIVGGALAMLISLILNQIGLVANFNELVIGSIMLLVPGLAITNAIRDTIAGDLVSGLARAIEAFLVAIGIAIGSGMILGFWISTFGGVS